MGGLTQTPSAISPFDLCVLCGDQLANGNRVGAPVYGPLRPARICPDARARSLWRRGGGAAPGADVPWRGEHREGDRTISGPATKERLEGAWGKIAERAGPGADVVLVLF